MSTINITIGNVTLNIGSGGSEGGGGGSVSSGGSGGTKVGEGSEVPIGECGIRQLEAVTTTGAEDSIGTWTITGDPFEDWNTNADYVQGRDYWNWDSPAWPDAFCLVPRSIALGAARSGGRTSYAIGGLVSLASNPSVDLNNDKLWRMKRWKLVSGTWGWHDVDVWLHRAPGSQTTLSWYAVVGELVGTSPSLLNLGSKERVKFEKLTSVPSWPTGLYGLTQTQL